MDTLDYLRNLKNQMYTNDPNKKMKILNKYEKGMQRMNDRQKRL